MLEVFEQSEVFISKKAYYKEGICTSNHLKKSAKDSEISLILFQDVRKLFRDILKSRPIKVILK